MRRYLIMSYLLVCALCVAHAGRAAFWHKRHVKYTIAIPAQMQLVADTAEHERGEMYYDSTVKMVLMVTEEDSKFKSVKSYIDCSKQELEKMLQLSYEDTTLRLLSCNRSPYYPAKINVIVFDVSVLASGFNRCIVYFVHHRHRDLQFSFLYNRDNAQRCMTVVDGTMKTLKLK